MRPVVIAAACSVVAIAIVSVPTLFTHKNTQSSKQKSVVSIPKKTSDAVVTVNPVIQDSQALPALVKKNDTPIALKKSHPERNEFVYEPEKSSDFTGTQGTQISFSAHAFVDEITGEPVKGPVDVKINEYYAMDDILLNDLHTMTKDGMLETNGMIDVRVSANGKRCKLANDKFMRVSFPMVNDKPDMQLFWKEQNEINAVWNSIPFQPINNILLIEALPKEEGVTPENAEPKLSKGLTSLRSYINASVQTASNGWSGNMEVEFCVSPWGTTEDIKVIKEINAEATAEVGLAFSKLTWKKGYKNFKPARYTATIELQYKSSQPGISNISFKKPFTDAPYKVNKVSQPTMSYTVSRLGWINCDRFINYTKRTNFEINSPGDKYVNVKMVFEKYKSILPADENSDSYSFKNVPADEPITVIAIRKHGDKYEVALEHTNTSAGAISALNYKPVTKDQLREIILGLDKISKPVTKNTTAMR